MTTVGQVRAAIDGEPDSATISVWAEGIRIRRNGGYREFGPSYGKEIETLEEDYADLRLAPKQPVVLDVPEWRTVRVIPLEIRRVAWLTSHAAANGHSQVAHIPNLESDSFTMSWQVSRKTGETRDTWVHTVAVCGQHWSTPIGHGWVMQDVIHETFPKGFRVCKLCIKYYEGDLPVCQHCLVPLTGQQRKWCSAHSAAHMRKD